MYFFGGLKQDLYVLILECFEPGINVSINTDAALDKDATIDTMT